VKQPDNWFLDWINSGAQMPRPRGLPVSMILSQLRQGEKTNSNAQPQGNEVSELSNRIGALLCEDVQNIVIDIPNFKGMDVYGSGKGAWASWLSIRGVRGITISDARLQHLTIDGADVLLKNCWIAEVHVLASVKLKIENCWVGKLTAAPNSLSNLVVKGGGFLDFDLPQPGGANPFLGAVVFNSIYLPRSTSGVPLEGAQQYRNLRSHLLDLQDLRSAGVVHAAEQAVERETDGWFSWSLSWLYQLASDFGYSPLRPVLWFFAVWIGLAALLMITGAALSTVGCEPLEDVIGWRQTLCAEGVAGDLARATALSAPQPFSILAALAVPGRQVAIIAESFWVDALLVLSGLISTVLLALFIFAVRRRFRLSE